MATNLALDDKLIEEAVRVGGHKTKEAAVTAALTEIAPAPTDSSVEGVRSSTSTTMTTPPWSMIDCRGTA